MSPAAEIARLLSRADRPQDMLIELVHTVMRLGEADSCDLLLREGEDRLALRASTVVPDLVGRVKLGKGVGLVGVAMTTAQAVYVSERATEDPRFVRYPGYDYPDCEAVAALPMRVPEGFAHRRDPASQGPRLDAERR